MRKDCSKGSDCRSNKNKGYLTHVCPCPHLAYPLGQFLCMVAGSSWVAWNRDRVDIRTSESMTLLDFEFSFIFHPWGSLVEGSKDCEEDSSAGSCNQLPSYSCRTFTWSIYHSSRSFTY